MKIAYADPPYPGNAEKIYGDHPDYAGEVDHPLLIGRLRANYAGWALSTSAAALRNVLPLCPENARVLAWVKHTVTVSWEPVIVVSARKPDRSLRDWIEVEPDSYQWREKPEGYVTGQKPEAFCVWLFSWLGAQPEDDFADLFPGSGAVGRAWERWRQQPELPRLLSAGAERRRERRDRARLLADHPRLT